MTKNGIKIKKEYKQRFLACCLQHGIIVRRTNTVFENHIAFTIRFKHVQDVFKAGYSFAKFI